MRSKLGRSLLAFGLVLFLAVPTVAQSIFLDLCNAAQVCRAEGPITLSGTITMNGTWAGTNAPPSLPGPNSWAGLQTFTGGVTVPGTATFTMNGTWAGTGAPALTSGLNTWTALQTFGAGFTVSTGQIATMNGTWAGTNAPGTLAGANSWTAANVFTSGTPWYGVAAPTGNAATDAANIQAAINSARSAGKGIVVLQAGSYNTCDLDATAINGGNLIDRGVIIQGAGAASTTLNPLGACTNTILDLTSSSGVLVRDLTCGGGVGQVPAPKTCIMGLAPTSGSTPRVRLENIIIDGYWKQSGVYLYGCTDTYLRGVRSTNRWPGAGGGKTEQQASSIYVGSLNPASLTSDYVTAASSVQGGDRTIFDHVDAIDLTGSGANVGLMLDQVHIFTAIGGQFSSTGTADIVLANQSDTVTFINPQLVGSPNYGILSGVTAGNVGIQTFGLTIINPYIVGVSNVIGTTGPSANHGGWIDALTVFGWSNSQSLNAAVPMVLSELQVSDNTTYLRDAQIWAMGHPITAGNTMTGILYRPGAVTMQTGTDSTLHITTTGLSLNGTTLLPILSGTTASIGGGALLAGQCTSGTVSITGSTTSMVAETDPNTYPGDGTTWSAQVTSNGTVTVKVCAIVGLTPTASTYNVRVLQ